jgi:hypothetical protein
MLDINKDILLFYRKHEHDYPARDVNRTTSGFMMWFELLSVALRQAGYTSMIFRSPSPTPRIPSALSARHWPSRTGTYPTRRSSDRACMTTHDSIRTL